MFCDWDVSLDIPIGRLLDKYVAGRRMLVLVAISNAKRLGTAAGRECGGEGLGGEGLG